MAATDADGRRPLAGFVYSFQEDALGKHWLLHEGENLVGRAETNVKCEIPIAHGTTSTRHATIRCANGGISIQDMKSTNGTYVNGRRLEPNVPTPLNDGDKVRFGGFTVNLVLAVRT
jgi:pSer/pThr/pTyr-binding forkhead associated (FHA) protein